MLRIQLDALATTEPTERAVPLEVTGAMATPTEGGGGWGQGRVGAGGDKRPQMAEMEMGKSAKM